MKFHTVDEAEKQKREAQRVRCWRVAEIVAMVRTWQPSEIDLLRELVCTHRMPPKAARYDTRDRTDPVLTRATARLTGALTHCDNQALFGWLCVTRDPAARPYPFQALQEIADASALQQAVKA